MTNCPMGEPLPCKCLQEACAWWDEEKNCCSIKVIAKELSRIQVSNHEV